MTTYLDYAVFDALSEKAFQNQKPYPWVNAPNTMTPEGFARLYQSVPDISLFERHVGVKRAHGQGYHNRAILHHLDATPVAAPWKEFIAELHGPRYLSFLRRMLNVPPSQRLSLTMEWYYAWKDCAVSHCDARRKLATHIFYFASDQDWHEDWGGHVLILDDEGRFPAHSAPSYDQLKVAARLDARKNASLLFQRTEHSWHAVRPLASPREDIYRKLFIVTVNIPTLQVWWRRVRGKDPDGYRLTTAHR